MVRLAMAKNIARFCYYFYVSQLKINTVDEVLVSDIKKPIVTLNAKTVQEM